jgi:aryl-alcohol dehydrogenase-like predicted oxidoreductase
METRWLGRSGLEVTALCFGSFMTFEYMDRGDARAVLRGAVEGGVRFLDDARYDDRRGDAPIPSGYSEVILGELFREGGFPRDEFVVADKLWFEFFPEESIEAELDGSLGRLGMDRIDLIYCAEPPDFLALPDLVGELDRLAGKGKIRAWGVLNWPPALLEEAARLAEAEHLLAPCAAQLPHNLFDRGFVEAPPAERALAASGVSVVASHCLAGGLLTGKYSRPGATGRHPPGVIERLRERGVLQRIDAWSGLAAEHGVTLAQLALAFSLSRPGVASACFGARSLAQLEEDLATLALLDRLAPAIERLAVAGKPGDPPAG